MDKVKIKPKLVDYELFKKPKLIKPKIENIPIDFSIYYNLIGISIIIIGSLYLYNKLYNKEEIKEQEKYKLIEMNEYIKTITG